MEYENVWLVSCSGTVEQISGNDYILDIESGVGVIAEQSGDVEPRISELSAQEGVIDISLYRSIDRARFISLIRNPPEGFVLTEVFGHVIRDGVSSEISKEDLGGTPIEQTIIKTARLECEDDGTVIEYSRGLFQTDSRKGLEVLCDEIAPHFLTRSSV